jgi:hypothetical protein
MNPFAANDMVQTNQDAERVPVLNALMVLVGKAFEVLLFCVILALSQPPMKERPQDTYNFSVLSVQMLFFTAVVAAWFLINQGLRVRSWVGWFVYLFFYLAILTFNAQILHMRLG